MPLIKDTPTIFYEIKIQKEKTVVKAENNVPLNKTKTSKKNKKIHLNKTKRK